MLKSTYDWVMGLAARKDAIWVLAAVAFIESSVFPIPPDVLLIPMVLAARDSAWRYAAVCTIASVLGGMAGYAIGLFLFESAGLPKTGELPGAIIMSEIILPNIWFSLLGPGNPSPR